MLLGGHLASCLVGQACVPIHGEGRILRERVVPLILNAARHLVPTLPLLTLNQVILINVVRSLLACRLRPTPCVALAHYLGAVRALGVLSSRNVTARTAC